MDGGIGARSPTRSPRSSPSPPVFDGWPPFDPSPPPVGRPLGQAGAPPAASVGGRGRAAPFPRPAPTRTCTPANTTSTNTSDQASRDGETSLPQRRTTTPSRPAASRSHRAFSATHRPAPPTGPSASAAPIPSRPPVTVVRTAMPDLFDPMNQPATITTRPSQKNTG